MRGERVHERKRSPVLGYRLEHLGKRYQREHLDVLAKTVFMPGTSNTRGKPGAGWAGMSLGTLGTLNEATAPTALGGWSFGCAGIE